MRTIDLVSAGYPTRYAFGGAARGSVNPYINILNRLVVVQFEDFEGDLKTLVWEPTVPEGSSEAPFYAQLIERYGERLSRTLLSNEYNTVASALASCGLAPEDVDYVSFDHLHVQDMRILMGTTQPVEGEPEPRPPFFPERQVPLPAQGGGHVPLAAPDAVGLVRARRHGPRDRGQPRAGRRRRRAGRGRGARRGPRATPTATSRW